MKRIITIAILIAAAFGAGSSTMQASESVSKLTKNQVKALIISAKTPADHMKLANYYRLDAKRLEADVRDHEEMAAAYDKNPSAHPIPKGTTLGDHCRSVAKNYVDSAKEANEMADMHEEMAKNAK